MLFKYIIKKITKRRKKRSMEKVISELQKLLESGAITQEDFDLAVSKLKSEETKEPNVPEPSLEPTEEDSTDADSQTDGGDNNPAPSDDDVPPEKTTTSDSGGNEEFLNQILKKIDDLEKKIENLNQQQEVDPTKPVPNADSKNQKEESDYGPGVRTVYSKK